MLTGIQSSLLLTSVDIILSCNLTLSFRHLDIRTIKELGLFFREVYVYIDNTATATGSVTWYVVSVGILIISLFLFPIWALWLNTESLLLLTSQDACVAK